MFNSQIKCMKKSVPRGDASRTRSLLKILVIMKLAIFLILFSVVQSKATDANGQNISLDVKDMEIRKVLNAIEKDGSYRFLYNYDLKGLKNKVDFSASNLPLTTALDNLLAGSGLRYKIVSKSMIAVLSVNEEENREVRITGKITGTNDEPLAGVSIQEKGTSTGTTTDNFGIYALTVGNNATLVISYVGYETQEVVVSGRSVIDVKLAALCKTDRPGGSSGLWIQEKAKSYRSRFNCNIGSISIKAYHQCLVCIAGRNSRNFYSTLFGSAWFRRL